MHGEADLARVEGDKERRFERFGVFYLIFSILTKRRVAAIIRFVTL